MPSLSVAGYIFIGEKTDRYSSFIIRLSEGMFYLGGFMGDDFFENKLAGHINCRCTINIRDIINLELIKILYFRTIFFLQHDYVSIYNERKN